MAAPTAREVVGAGFSAEQTRQLSTSSAPQVGDLLLVAVFNDFNGSSGVGPPAGTWTTLTQAGGSEHAGVALYSRAVTAAGVQTVTVDGDNSEGGLVVYVLPAGTTVDVSDAAVGDGTSQAAPSVTTTGADRLLICVWCEGTFGGSSGYTGTPSGMTVDVDAADPDDFIALRAAHQAISAAGATGTRTTTGASPDLGWAAATVALAAAAGGPEAHNLSATVPLTLVGSAGQAKSAGLSSSMSLGLAAANGEAKAAALSAAGALTLAASATAVDSTAESHALSASAPLTLAASAATTKAGAVSTVAPLAVAGDVGQVKAGPVAAAGQLALATSASAVDAGEKHVSATAPLALGVSAALAKAGAVSATARAVLAGSGQLTKAAPLAATAATQIGGSSTVAPPETPDPLPILLRTPTVNTGVFGRRGLLRFYTYPEGVSLIKTLGTWRQQQYPSSDELFAADNYFLGGHTYEITQAMADELTAAGFGDLIENQADHAYGAGLYGVGVYG